MAEIVKLNNQDHSSLKRTHNSSNLFQDSAFPPKPKSIGDSTRCVWRRPRDICDNPRFIVEGTSRFDLFQGEVGNCWFIAAAQALAEDEQLFNVVVPAGQDFGKNYAGIFRFRFWRKDHWVEVVVDDYLPTTTDGRLKFCRNKRQPNEFWAPLLEKAYAKLYGSYQELDGGLTKTALMELTAGNAKSHGIKKESAVSLWHLMSNAHRRRALMTCSISRPDDASKEAKLANGLVVGHAYTVTKVAIAHYKGQHRLVRLRNPWGNDAEWNRDWGDQSSKWKSTYLQRQLDFVKAPDGEFWMSFEDFRANFDWLTVCLISPKTARPTNNRKAIHRETVRVDDEASPDSSDLPEPSGNCSYTNPNPWYEIADRHAAKCDVEHSSNANVSIRVKPFSRYSFPSAPFWLPLQRYYRPPK